MSWKTRKADGRHFQERPKSIFHAPKDKHIAREINGSSPIEARASVETLAREFNQSGRAKQIRIWKAVQEEANRAEIGSNNPNNGQEAQLRQREIEEIYRKEAIRMHDKLYDSGEGPVEVHRDPRFSDRWVVT